MRPILAAEVLLGMRRLMGLVSRTDRAECIPALSAVLRMAGSREGTHPGDSPALAVSMEEDLEEGASTAEEDSTAVGATAAAATDSRSR